jgi:hypothetical protein
MRQLPGSGGSGRASRVAQGFKRIWPLVLMGWERWQSLPPEQRERYKRQAREYGERGRKALSERRRRR